ncbi:heterotrimeric GTP-binding alpha subunit [Panaeolus papilionaceus]|nr:heterotrimeric GTP-binding alpha subunit [Panaeolus papilionaceus]
MSLKMRSKPKSPPTSPSIPHPGPQASRWGASIASGSEERLQTRAENAEQALKISKEIDSILQEGRKQLERRKKATKILLLGQSESGKSSFLKNFQLTFAPKHFDTERLVWRIIIQLNIIGSIKTILDALSEECEPQGPYSNNTGSQNASKSTLLYLRRMRFALSPLFSIESDLLRMLAPDCTDSRDMSVRAGAGWKTLLRMKNSGYNPRDSYDVRPMLTPELDPTSVFAAQRDDIIAFWKDADIQDVLRRRRPRLRDTSGFFMDDLDRIATANYIPTDSDIIRARIKTMGVEEHSFLIERGRDANSEFIITDVGGTRHQRASWAPFFDDVQAILFLAPLAFNQMLEEDNKVNRLEDSLYLWRDLCGNRLLIHANIILFFNKMDVLENILASGVVVKKYVPTFGDLPNDVPTVIKYFKDKFRIYHKKLSPESRPFFVYETSAIDIKSMSILLSGVRESILRQNLRQGDML